MCWYLAGQDLCWIKINATGPSRAVLNELYNSYRPDKKIVRRDVGQEDDEDDKEDPGDLGRERLNTKHTEGSGDQGDDQERKVGADPLA